jgi:hypothetical protein
MDTRQEQEAVVLAEQVRLHLLLPLEAREAQDVQTAFKQVRHSTTVPVEAAVQAPQDKAVQVGPVSAVRASEPMTTPPLRVTE